MAADRLDIPTMAKANYNNQEIDRLVEFFLQLEKTPHVSIKKLNQLLKIAAKDSGDFWSKTELLAWYQQLAGTRGLQPLQSAVCQALQMKPTRTISGVAPVTVLTKPFPCPGKCIFCPNDIRMPKSYLSNEPGAQRAEKNYFDPYLQTYNRVSALAQMGHSVDKIELIILGGTWSYYPEAYQIWFIKECFRALNEFGVIDESATIREKYTSAASALNTTDRQLARTDDPAKNEAAFADFQLVAGVSKATESNYNQTVAKLYTKAENQVGLTEYQRATWTELETEQKRNETTRCRCVGLVIETRPDNISSAEVLKIRRLGCTKTQIGVQSLQDEVLTKNHRGHDVAATRRAFALLRQAGFKIHAHWMPNLYGSNPTADKADYEQLFADPAFRPDELKIYPCSLIESAELMTYHQQGLWQPYTEPELLSVLTHCFVATPLYTRLTRVIRDIPSTDIVVGNKKTNFRQLVEQWLIDNTVAIKEIRSREIRQGTYDESKVSFTAVSYRTTVSQELFIQCTAPNQQGVEKLLAFLRLSLPDKNITPLTAELAGAAMIREIHVYGQATAIGHRSSGRAQHVGFGRRLQAIAAEISKQHGYQKLAVISAIGTREYYRSLGFVDGDLYQFLSLTDELMVKNNDQLKIVPAYDYKTLD